MSKQETKRQHFVPRTYLKHFAEKVDDKFFISALPKDSTKVETIKKISITNVGLENDIYTLPGETREQRLLIEQFYSDKYETHYDRIYEILIDPAKVKLTEEEHQLVVSTVVTMLYRTTKWVNSFNEFIKREFEGLYDLCEYAKTDYFIFEGEKVSIKGKSKEQLYNEYKFESRPEKIISQLEIALKLIKLRASRDGIYVVKLIDKDCEFVTSDNPVIYSGTGLGRAMPFDPENLLSLPLDNKHRLTLMPFAESKTKLFIFRNNETGNSCFMQKLTSNYEQLKNCERFMLGTDTGLKNYLSTKEWSEKPR